MAAMDLRKAMNAISAVVNNRPKPLREVDQIYMKSADMLLQAEHISRWLDGRDVIFIGDGDAIGLSLVHLHAIGILQRGPSTLHVVDFDERVVRSIQEFVNNNRLKAKVTAELYNVADPLPRHLWRQFSAFYTNPPYGKSNDGKSIHAFMRRGIEACGEGAIGCVVLADHSEHEWTQSVLHLTEKYALDNGFMIAELVPSFHGYHLDDAPDLTSCSLVIKRCDQCGAEYASEELTNAELVNFYGKNIPLNFHYIKDLTNGGKMASNDHRIEPYDRTRSLFQP
jgi:N4-bis(aminopropyl)spermidine synthase